MAKRKYLTWWDILFITVIMIGIGMYQSNIIYLARLQSSVTDYPDKTIFTLWDNLRGILVQSVQLIVAILYLKLRNFDFVQWKFKISIRDTIFGIFLFIICAVLMDIWITIWDYLIFFTLYTPEILKPTFITSSFLSFSLSNILYALLNGPYEELFFLGVCLSVKPEYRIWAFWYSMAIRISFHTYQGIGSAFGIGIILTVIYYHFYVRKSGNLYPYFLSHAVADIFGLGIAYHIIYWVTG